MTKNPAIFLPSSDAFKKLPKQIFTFLQEENTIKRIALNHIIAGHMYTAEQLSKFKTIGSLAGPLCIDDRDPNKLLIDGAVIQQSLVANDSIIHVVDKILYPSACRLQITNPTV